MLKQIDINRRRTIDPALLPVPSHAVVSKKKMRELNERQKLPAPIGFHGLQRRIYELLAMDFADAEELAEGRAMTPREIEDTFYDHLQLLDTPTRRLLEPTMAGWLASEEEELVPEAAASTSVSARIMQVLCLKRSVLRQGMEVPLQDILDRLLLCVRLEERMTIGAAKGLLAGLGKNSRPAAEAVLRDLPAGYGPTALSDGALVDTAALYLRLRDGLRSPLTAASHFTGRYHGLAFDELIDKDDSLPPLRIFTGAHNGVTPLMRELTCEHLFKVVMDPNLYIAKVETFFLATTLLDRFLAAVPVPHSELFLYGAAALLAAIKFEETYLPHMSSIARSFKGAVTVESLLAAEVRLVLALQVRVGSATLSHLSNALIVEQDPPATAAQRHLLLYIIATLAVRTHLGQFKQALLAAAAVYITRVVYAIHTGEPSDAIRAVLPHVLHAAEMNRRDEEVGRALHEQFSQQRYSAVSRLPLLRLFGSEAGSPAN